MTRGIDYSGPSGTCNRDPETGIRYGIIPLHRLNEFAYDSFDAEYDASCPNCGADVPEDTQFTSDNRPSGVSHGWYAICSSCERPFAEDSQYPDEPSRQVLREGTLEGFLDSSGDVWVVKSEFFTRAAFCSPCAPGACYLTSPTDDGERAYCLGPDWFDGEAPYPIYSVATGERVA